MQFNALKDSQLRRPESPNSRRVTQVGARFLLLLCYLA